MVQATNGRFFSAESNEVAVKTLDPTLDYMKVSALPASFITGDSFTANWEPLADAEYYTVTLYSRQLGVPFEVKATFTSQLLPEGWAISSCSYDSRAAYCVEAPSLRLGSQRLFAHHRQLCRRRAHTVVLVSQHRSTERQPTYRQWPCWLRLAGTAGYHSSGATLPEALT